MRRAFQATILAFAVAGAAGTAMARPVVPAEKRYYDFDADIPACDDPAVLDRIKDRFGQKEDYYWNTSLEIVSYDRVRLLAVRPWGLDHVPRNFCVARALLNDNSFHEVSYSVIENAGIIGFDWGVEWCVQGIDRNLAYAPNCQLSRP